MDRNAFIFNTNKCVACMACVLGCSIENGTDPGMNWRNLSSFNALRHPALPVFHFSIACNHCLDAPCMDNCPALAYTRDKRTGAVLHEAEACIGCKYCTWACPYDAPKFNPSKGIIEKCNFCVDRLNEGQKPACASACPVGALDYGIEKLEDDEPLVPGFVHKAIRPSIQIIPLRKKSEQTLLIQSDTSSYPTTGYTRPMHAPASKVQLRKEWALVPFTLTIATLVGWMGAHIGSLIPLPLPWFLGLGFLAMSLSLFHLGKKQRAWRALLNLRRSWLSREIFSILGFLGFGCAELIYSNPFFQSMTIGFGVLSLVAIDMVYHLLDRKEKMASHSAMMVITGFLVYATLSTTIFLIGFTFTLKFGLYLYRKITYLRLQTRIHLFSSLIRLICLIVPLIYVGTGWIAGMTDWMALSILALGEIIDRSEYYSEARVTEPQSTLFDLYKTMTT